MANSKSKSKSTGDVYSRVQAELYTMNILLPGLPACDKYKTLFDARQAEPMMAGILAKLTDNELDHLMTKISDLL